MTGSEPPRATDGFPAPGVDYDGRVASGRALKVDHLSDRPWREHHPGLARGRLCADFSGYARSGVRNSIS